ncbi:L-seryl-tRNA(Sec) selenium transferase [candidate division KSB1 bacterium]
MVVKKVDKRRQIPSVDSLLKSDQLKEIIDIYPRPLLLATIREFLDSLRESSGKQPADLGEIAAAVRDRLKNWSESRLRHAVNATGVIIHTGLGRAPLPEEVFDRIRSVGDGYSTLEIDPVTGDRASRTRRVEDMLILLTGAEAALVVNNNAAAVMLALNTMAKGRETVISRAELVEIGGSFRLPDIITAAGALLREVGTSNRTTIDDYKAAIHKTTALLLKIHQSNFRMVGFVGEASINELVGLSAETGLPLVHDLGSSALFDTAPFTGVREPLIAESIKAGVQVVTASFDKLLGGPQAGILLGEAGLIESMRKNPLARCVRVDKIILAALEATLEIYLNSPESLNRLPVYRLLSIPAEDIRRRAEKLINRIEKSAPKLFRLTLKEGSSTVGGGSLPGESLPTWLVAVTSAKHSPDRLAAVLRLHDPPVFARIRQDELLIDLRTVETGEEGHIIDALKTLAGEIA